MASAARIRMDPEERKVRLRGVARTVFASNGYNATGLVEVADRAGVSKGLLYHYYPNGRPELYVAVMDDVYEELLAAVRPALQAPFRVERRLELFVEAAVDFFGAHNDAYRLLFREPPGSGEADIVNRVAAVEVSLAGELAKAIAATAASADQITIVSFGIIGFLLHASNLFVEHRVDRATTIAATTAFIAAGVVDLEGRAAP